MTGGSTLLSLTVAFAIALSVGPLLGRLSGERLPGRGFSNLLTEGRGAFLTYFIAPALIEATRLPSWIAIGVVIGITQAISVSRWVARREGQWSRTLLAGIALGRSLATLLSARARARGAVISTLALTLIHVISLEMLLTALDTPGLTRSRMIGTAIVQGSIADILPVIALGVACILAAEITSSWLFQHRPRRRE